MQISRGSAIALSRAVDEGLKLESTPLKFRFALARNKSRLQKVVDEHKTMASTIAKAEEEINAKYALRDSDNKAIIIKVPGPDGRPMDGYSLPNAADCPEFFAAKTKLMAEANAYMAESIEFDSYKISEEAIDATVSGSVLGGIICLVND